MVQDVQTVVAGYRCPRCNGNILTIWDETKCVQCGHEVGVDHTPVPLAVEPRWGRRWPDGREQDA